ncbi:MAG TPA: accessory Sec system translocase SecA2 [Bacillota bacterium]|nr:accessory Sec system translocase SecA2 [Bacillota bacterium]
MSLNLKKFANVSRIIGNECDEPNLESYQNLLEKIKKIELHDQEDSFLQKMSQDLIHQAKNGVPLDDLLTPAYALVCEAFQRVLGIQPYDVQILGAIALHYGKLIEMQTGEGKTLAAVFPAYLNSIAGQGVHILTFNDYLARRDARWMGPVFHYLGLKVDYIQEGMESSRRKQAYQSDITYLTAKEAGFDYLRSFLCYDPAELVQRPFNYAIIDEADAILIDEGRIPLVIAGSNLEDEETPHFMAQIAGTLKPNLDFELDEFARNITLTESGVNRVESLLGCGNLYAAKNFKLLTQLNNALHAEVLLKRDHDYIVRNETIELVDEFTGRVADKRHWPDALQAAVEAKEGLQSQRKGRIYGSITMQQFLEAYPKICGMTGTAKTAAEEIKVFYNLDVVIIPSNRPCIRIDHPDFVFTHKGAKFKALIDEITQVHATGRPILVGTSSIAESEDLATQLRQQGIICQVLNAKNDEVEAAIIAEAGALGAVTISTNMAGRGTDIRLGGYQEQTSKQVIALGGLYVIGTSRFESRRVDDQLRGRAGRQGDPGSSRFFISLEDDLIVRYGMEKLISSRKLPAHQAAPLNDPLIHRKIMVAQKIIEGQNFELRETLWNYSWIIEKQRRMIHQRRQNILLEKIPYTFLKTKAPERYLQLLSKFGEPVLLQLERQITLFCIDSCWADYLDEVANIREGIHLVAIAGQTPIDIFRKTVAELFQDLLQNIDSKIIDVFETIAFSENGFDLQKEGIKAPTATWTYLVNDRLFEGQLGAVFVRCAQLPTGFMVAWLPILFRFFWRPKSRKDPNNRGIKKAGQD